MSQDKIKLVSETNGEKEFPYEQAKAVLARNANKRVKTWTLPTDSLYTFDNGNLIKRGGAQPDKGAETSTGDPESQG